MKQTPQQQARLFRLQNYKEVLENEQIIKELPQFNALPATEVARRIGEWNAYYDRVKGGKSFTLYTMSRSALKGGNLDVVRTNGLRARKALSENWEEDLQRPTFRDPYEFYNSSFVGSYKAVCAGIEELEGKVEKAPF